MGGEGIGVNVDELKGYVKTLDFYGTESTKFGGLVDTAAGVGDESWGLIGLAVKGQYTTKLDELKDLLGDLQEAIGDLGDKVSEAATVYESTEQDHVISFGKHEAEIDGIGKATP